MEKALWNISTAAMTMMRKMVKIMPKMMVMMVSTTSLLVRLGAEAGARLQNLLLQHVRALSSLRHLAAVHDVWRQNR